MIRIISFIFLLSFGLVQSQELNCTVSINSQSLDNSTQQVFKTLKTSLNEFVNQTQWTGRLYKQNEKINCSMFITITSNNSDQFSGTIQVQSSRLVYNSTYSSPVFNFNDKDFSFRYTEFENLIFNPSEYSSNLVSVISFYCYVILGMDADSFIPQGGNSSFEIAQNIANVAQQSGNKGWGQNDGIQSRFFLINDLLSPVYKDIRQTNFLYHSGLDLMNQDLKSAKEKVKASILNIENVYNQKPTAFMTRVFYDAKSDEIVSIFSGGPSIPITDLVETLNKTSPLNATNWANIKF